jgi:hypothetical protein
LFGVFFLVSIPTRVFETNLPCALFSGPIKNLSERTYIITKRPGSMFSMWKIPMPIRFHFSPENENFLKNIETSSKKKGFIVQIQKYHIWLKYSV